MAEIDIQDFKPNSRKYHEEQEAKESAVAKKVEKVVQGSATKTKKSIGRRFFDVFVDENVGDVKSYLFYDVLVPAIKENIADLINSAVGMIFFGEAVRRPPRRSGGSSTGSKVNYGGYFNSGARSERMPRDIRSRGVHEFDDIRFESRGEAELVLDNMLEILGDYKQVTVADFYDLAGVTTEFTDNKWGWTDLRGARVIGNASRGYFVDLPRCMALE